jgi:hypothetical protein
VNIKRDATICLFIGFFSLSIGLMQFFAPPEGHEAYYSVQGSPFSDAMAYDRAAIDLKDGLGFRDAWIFTMAGMRAPAYVALVAAVYDYVGHKPSVVYLVQTGMVALTCVAVYLIGAVTFSRFVGATAAVALAMYQPFYGWANTIMSEVAFICTLSLALLGVLTCERRPLQSAAAGFWAAVCVIIKTLGIFPLGFMWLFLVLRRRQGSEPKSWATPFALLLGAAVLLLPYTLRNWVALGLPTPVSTLHVWHLWASYVPSVGGASEQAWADVVYSGADEKAIIRRLKKDTREAMMSDPPRVLRKVIWTFIRSYDGPPFRPSGRLDFLLFPLLGAGVMLGVVRGFNLKVALLVGSTLAIIFANAISLETWHRHRLIADWLILLIAIGGLVNWLAMLSRETPSEHLVPVPQVPPSLALIPTGALLIVGLLTAFPFAQMTMAYARGAHNRSARAVSDEEIKRAFGPVTGVRAVGERAQTLTFAEYRRQAIAQRGDLSALEGRLVAWRGLIEAVAVLPADREDSRGLQVILAKRPYQRTMATFRADDEQQGDPGRVWLEIPDQVARFQPNTLTRALVLGRIATNTSSPISQRYRLVAVAIHKEAR